MIYNHFDYDLQKYYLKYKNQIVLINIFKFFHLLNQGYGIALGQLLFTSGCLDPLLESWVFGVARFLNNAFFIPFHTTYQLDKNFKLMEKIKYFNLHNQQTHRQYDNTNFKYYKYFKDNLFLFCNNLLHFQSMFLPRNKQLAKILHTGMQHYIQENRNYIFLKFQSKTDQLFLKKLIIPVN